MPTTLTFSEIVKEHFPLLEQYMPVLVKEHGEAHPELEKVEEIFAEMNKKVKSIEIEEIDLSSEFKELRSLTNDYMIPRGGSETYAATYLMLESADKAYHA